MSIVNKWNKIIEWQSANTEVALGDLAEPITEGQLATIEKLLGEPLPIEFKTLYLFSNGQTDNGDGLLFGDGFVGSDEIIDYLEMHLALSKKQNKPQKRIVENPEKSQELIKKIVDFYLSHAPKNKFFGLQKSWYKIEFSCSIGSYEGPYYYKSEDATIHDRKYFEIEDYSPIEGVIYELYELEKKAYNWDALKIEVLVNGTFTVERKDDNFDEEIRRTSTPDNFIRKRPYHAKWVPVFSDYGGNYIGIDLDPDVQGVKGQIINFGRDEEDMFVFADGLEGFFDFILNEIDTNHGAAFNQHLHLHEILKGMKKI